MTDLVSGLLLYPTFRNLPTGTVEATAPLWRSDHLEAGGKLWTQGATSDGLAIVLRGEVEARVDGADRGHIGNGGIVGEATAFVEGGRRLASVVAVTPTDLAVLSAAAIVSLRTEHPVVYAALLDQALRALVRRVRAADRRIALQAEGGVPVPTRAEPGKLARMWRKLVPGLPKGASPPIIPLLRRQPSLADAPDAVVAAIGAQFTPAAVPEGHVLFLEGEEPDGAWLIAEGAVDVLRTVRGERAERIATLAPGDLFGINTLVESTPRTASCVTTAPGWLWRITADAAARLTGEAGIHWRECLLAALSAQLELAHATLRRVPARESGEPAFADDLDHLLHAQGYIEGLPVSAAELARVRLLRPRPGHPAAK